MKPVISSFVYGAAFALLMIGPTQGKDTTAGAATAGEGEEDVVCIGPGSLTGTVIDATTILTPHFSAYRCESHYPVQITVQFKDQSAAMKVGDTVMLKGRLVSVQDAHRGVQGLVLKNAEIAR